MIEELRRVRLFQPFSDAALHELATLLVEVRFARGDIVFREGEAGDSVYAIGEGEVEIRKRGATLSRFGPGRLFGDKHSRKDVRTTDAVCVSDARLFEIRHQELREFLLRHPQDAIEVLWGAMVESMSRLLAAREHLVAVFETGKIVSRHLGLEELSRQVLGKVLEAIPAATGALLIVRNPFTEELDLASAVDTVLLDLDSATSLVEAGATGEACHQVPGGSVLVAPLLDEAEVLGHILVERVDSAGAFEAEDMIIVTAVAAQVALGILDTYRRQEDEARARLQQRRSQGDLL